MARIAQPALSIGRNFLIGFLAAEVLLLTGTWQLAYLAGFLAGMFASRWGRAALLGALGVASAWAAYLAYVFAFGQGLPLANLVGAILGAGEGAWWLLTLLTIVLGALVGGVGGLTGYTSSRLFLWSARPKAADTTKGP